MSFYESTRTDQIFQAILEQAEAEQYDHSGSFGYTMPDGKHHIFLYRDRSEITLPWGDDDRYVIVPCKVIDGEYKPMCGTVSAPYGDLARLLIGCAWCMEQFEQDRPKEKAVFESNLFLPREEIDYLNALLTMVGEEIYDKYGLKCDETITNTVKFDNGFELDVKVVICEEDEKPYIDLVLFDDAGCEIACDTGDDEIEGTVEFETEDTRFICTIKPERELNQSAIYLCPQPEHQYSAAFSLSGPPAKGAVKLTDEHDYPVEIFFIRTDLNGSSCFESEQCTDLAQLLSTLDWCGKCCYTVQSVWDFNLDNTMDEKLVELFNDAFDKRMELTLADADLMQPIPDVEARVYAKAGTVRHQLFSGSIDECNQFCEDLGWKYLDENSFEWELQLDVIREMDEPAQSEPLDIRIHDALNRAGTPPDAGTPGRSDHELF